MFYLIEENLSKISKKGWPSSWIFSVSQEDLYVVMNLFRMFLVLFACDCRLRDTRRLHIVLMVNNFFLIKVACSSELYQHGKFLTGKFVKLDVFLEYYREIWIRNVSASTTHILTWTFHENNLLFPSLSKNECEPSQKIKVPLSTEWPCDDWACS